MLRVGGKLAVLDSFVPGFGRTHLSADELVEDLVLAIGNGSVLADVESIRSPASPTHDMGLIVTQKIGVPHKW